MPSPLLERIIFNYAKKMHKQKNGSRYASGAEYGYCKKVAKSGDHDFSMIANSLRIELENFGLIGAKIQRSSLGYCAEAVAVNRVLQVHPTRYSDIEVGTAFRIKTLQRGKKCIICRNMF